MVPGFKFAASSNSSLQTSNSSSSSSSSSSISSSKLTVQLAIKTSCDNVGHVMKCKIGNCYRCFYLRRFARWNKQTIVPALGSSFLTNGIWPSGKWGLGCRVCVLAQQSNAFATEGVDCGKLSNLLRHASSGQHLDALASLGLSTASRPDKACPSSDDFKKVAKHRLQGSSLSCPLDGVGGRKKLTNMQECLAEACFNIDRKLLRKAGSISFHQDVRQLILLVRFSACTPDLETAKGLAGYVQLERTRHSDLIHGTRLVLQRFCQSNADEVNNDLLLHIKAHTEALDADGAADEQLACRLLRSAQGELPHTKFVTRDRTHAARRFSECHL